MLDLRQVAEASLLVLTLLFSCAEAFILKQVWELYRPPKPHAQSLSFSGTKTRAIFVIFLAVSIAARVLSLLLIFFNPISYSFNMLTPVEDSNASPEIWTLTFLLEFPSLLFLSTYSVVILFFAQIYYTANWIEVPYLKAGFGFVNGLIYILLAVIGLLTHALRAFADFYLYTSIISGLLYTATAVAFCFYGFKVAFQFSGDANTRDHEARKAAVVRRVLSLSVFCPILFQCRGFFDLSVATGSFPWRGALASQLPITWEAMIIFLSEGIPATLVLITFWPAPKKGDNKYHGVIQGASPLVAPMLTTNNLPTANMVNAAGSSTSERSMIVVDSGLMNFVPPNVYPLGAQQQSSRTWK